MVNGWIPKEAVSFLPIYRVKLAFRVDTPLFFKQAKSVFEQIEYSPLFFGRGKNNGV